jgi:uroporphyrinogen-III synthase
VPAGALTVLITRPSEDAAPLAARLERLGHRTVIEPMLEIERLPGPALDLEGIQAFLFTSANGVRAAAARTVERMLPALAVGDATARAAREAGFQAVLAAGGTVGDLAVLAARTLDPGGGRLLHAAGTVVAGDLAGDLEGRGFAVDRQVLYAAHPASALSESTIRLLYAGTIDAILFFSPRTVKSFVKLAGKSGLEDRLSGVVALCLSEAVADVARTVPWSGIRVAGTPDQDALIDLLDEA